MLKIIKSQTGETIIEVLISLSVLGLALGIGYASAGSSLRTTQDTQERTEATLISQSLIETTKYLINRESSNAAAQPQLFPPGALNSSGSRRDICLTSNPGDLTTPSAYRVKPNSPNPGSHQECFKGTDNRYLSWVNVERTQGGNGASSSTSRVYLYTATVQWEGLNGDANEVIMRYSRKIVN
jgi:type II secretory pathway pseudopilin PulG